MANVARFNEWKRVNRERRAPKCTMCNAEKPSFCASCNSSAYCGRDCQKEDWPLHKIFCKAYKLFLVLRPDLCHKVGILFPVDEEMPKLVWIPTIASFRTVQENPHIAAMHFETAKELKSFIGGAEEHTLFSEVNILRNFPIIHQLELTRRKDHESQPVNKCILKLTGGTSGEFWKGPVVVTRHIDYGYPDQHGEGTPEGNTFYYAAKAVDVEDMALSDLRHAVDWFAKFPEFIETMIEEQAMEPDVKEEEEENIWGRKWERK